jgi:hypothetical protein
LLQAAAVKANFTFALKNGRLVVKFN